MHYTTTSPNITGRRSRDLLWLIPFAVSIPIYPLKQSQSPLFETIMPITLTVFVCVFSIFYLKRMEGGFLSESIKLGVIWFGISIISDLLMFMWGPMKMAFMPDTMADLAGRGQRRQRE